LGFIGSHVASRLKELDYEVLQVDLNFKKKVPGVWYGSVSWDCFLKTFVDQELDYIFHFGSPCSVLQFQEDSVYCVQDTLKGFLNVLKLAQYTKAKLLYPSSGNIYGCLIPPYDEDMNAVPNNLYGICKYLCESLSKANDKVDSVALRVFTGYGPGEEGKGNLASVVYLFLSKMRRNESPVIWGDGEQRRDCIYVDDIVEAFIRAMHVKNSPINVASGKDYSYNQIVEKINKVLGKDIKPVYTGKPKNYVDNAVADTTLMKKYLRLHPISLEEGLKKFSGYLDEHSKN
jgi:UDP-glucose 4-epimerase